MLRQVKRNSQQVTTTLGGGHLGYLDISIPLATYNYIPNSPPFRQPKNLVIFTTVVPDGPATCLGIVTPVPLTAVNMAT